MIDNCYSFTELKEKFGWETSLNEIKKQIIFARRRGIIIEPAFKKGPTYFRIIEIDNYPNEIWKNFPDVTLNLEVSNLGRVRDITSKAFLGYEGSDGYIKIKRFGTTYLVHRLVLQTFQPIENDTIYFVDHIDGIRSNNQLINLRWVKHEENLLFRNENWQELAPIIEKIIQKYGYEEAKMQFSSLL